MNLIIYKYYEDINKMQEEIDSNASNGDETIAYVSGNNDIMVVLKELIKTEYKAS